MRFSVAIVIAVLCLLAGLAGYLFYEAETKPLAAETAAGEPIAPGVEAAVEGDAAPTGLKLTDLDGKTHSLEDYRGKLLVVNFWATWCAPCLHEIPALVKIQNDYAARGFQIIGPAVDEADEVRKASPGFKFNYPVLVGTPEEMLDLMSALGNAQGGLPFSVVIGPDGTVLQRQLGEFSAVELAGLIEEQLAKQN